jgi:hypothetical protein
VKGIRIAAWAVFLGALVWASANIPRFSGQVPEKGVVFHPRLFPYYFQSNIDAPLELSTAIGFPEYYKVAPNRVNRPVVYAIIAGVREAIASPLVTLFAGKDAGRQAWGAWTVRDYLLTYGIWMVFNLGLLLACAALYHRMARAHFDSLTASLAVMMMLSSPIVLLSLREIHLGVYHLFVGLACLAFWHAVLLGVPAGIPAGVAGSEAVRRPLSNPALIAASLAIGVLFLGKFCFNGFGAGLLLCLWMKQGRKLLLILPALATPTALWIPLTKVLGYTYGVSEVQDFGAGVWLLQVGSVSGLLREIASFLALWAKCASENLSAAHVFLAAVGAVSLWKKGRRAFLAVALLAILVDMGFYFLLHRVNANYVMSSLIFLFVPAAEGLIVLLQASGTRLPWIASDRFRAIAAVAILLALQFALNLRQLPHYAG